MNTPHTSLTALNKSAFGVTIYPDPTAGLFKVVSRQPLFTPVQVQVTDTYGRVISNGSWLKGKASIDFDLCSFVQGVYFVVLNREGDKYYQKIILTR